MAARLGCQQVDGGGVLGDGRAPCQDRGRGVRGRTIESALLGHRASRFSVAWVTAVWGCRRGGGCQPGQREGADQEAEVAQCDVVVVTDAEEIDDDAEQPRRDHVGADGGTHRHQDSRQDLDHADGQHGLVGGPGDQVVDPRRQVLLPVGEEIEELVEAEGDGGDGEDRAQQQERLTGTGGIDLALGVGRGEEAGDSHGFDLSKRGVLER